MIRIDMIRQNTDHPDRRKRHPFQASCEVDGRRYETTGAAPIYKLSTLLWLHGHGGAEYEVWDDVSPFGRPGGLALRGRVRNSARLVKGKPNFTRKAKPDPGFTPEECQVVSRAAGAVVGARGNSTASGLPGSGCATRPLDGPDTPRSLKGLYGPLLALLSR